MAAFLLKATEVLPITTQKYPTDATRLANARLGLVRLKEACRIEPPSWEGVLAEELNIFLSLARGGTRRSLYPKSCHYLVDFRP